MTLKSNFTSVLLCNGNERIQSLMNLMLMTVYTKYLYSLCISYPYRLVVGKITISFYKKETLFGVKIADIVEFVLTVAEMDECVGIQIVLNYGFELVKFLV